jgi:starvation-inducible DNA-binding protein
MPKSNVKAITKTQPSTAAALQNLLRDTYIAFLLTHNYHWNVEGQNFVGLHTLFEQHYTELFAAIDEIAERIRALDSYALPNHYAEIASGITALANPLTRGKDKSKTAAAEHMIQNLISVHEQVLASAKKAKAAANAAGDQESEDLVIARTQVHQKAMWMLRSIIK